jgi:hypothetical protein
MAAQTSCGARTYGFVGSITVASTGLSSIAAGLCTRYVSSGLSCATNTTSALSPARPARPACCQNDANVPG